MASKPRKKGNQWEIVVKRAGVLEKPLYLSFATEAAAIEGGKRIEALLDKKIVPTQLVPISSVTLLGHLIDRYVEDAHPSQKDRETLRTVDKTRGGTPLALITIPWVDTWITEMKRVDKLAPASIRAKVGAAARAWHWGQRKEIIDSPTNPFRDLPDGYSQYTGFDSKLAGVRKEDVERDRRLEPGEEDKIRAVILSGSLPRKQRPYAIPHPTDLLRDFTLALETAMRLRERYTLEVSQVRLHQRTIYLDRTKNGDSRNVPLSSVAVAVLQAQIEGKSPEDRVFPWWDGDASERGLKLASNFLSKLYAQVFETAGCGELTEHDLRHEGTSRFFEKTTLPGEAIMKITGHKSHKMLMRYLKLRGSDLADKLW